MEAASELASSSSEETTFEELRNESISLDSSTDGLPEDGEAGLLFTGEGLGASGVSENVRTRKNHSSLLLVAGEMGMSTISGAFFTFLWGVSEDLRGDPIARRLIDYKKDIEEVTIKNEWYKIVTDEDSDEDSRLRCFLKLRQISFG